MELENKIFEIAIIISRLRIFLSYNSRDVNVCLEQFQAYIL